MTATGLIICLQQIPTICRPGFLPIVSVATGWMPSNGALQESAMTSSRLPKGIRLLNAMPATNRAFSSPFLPSVTAATARIIRRHRTLPIPQAGFQPPARNAIPPIPVGSPQNLTSMMPISPYIREAIRENGTNAQIVTPLPRIIRFLAALTAMNTISLIWTMSTGRSMAMPITAMPVLNVIRKGGSNMKTKIFCICFVWQGLDVEPSEPALI